MNDSTVFIVDDDPDSLDSLRCLLQSVGQQVETFASSASFLQAYDPSRPGCIVLDIRMPGISGLELQQEIAARGDAPPVIVVTGFADVPVCSAAFRAGAFDFIEKPANHQLLLGRIQRAIELDALRRASRRTSVERQLRSRALTAREREVMELLTRGRTLKQIAGDLDITWQTAARHRSRILEKMGVSNDVELTRLVLEPADRAAGV